MKKVLTTVSAIALTAAFTGPALADAKTDAQIEALTAKINQMSSTIDSLRTEVTTLRTESATQKEAIAQTQKAAASTATKVSFAKGAPEISAPDGSSFKVRGQVAADAAFFNSRKGGNDYNNGTEIRRARLGIDGTYTKDWVYRLEADFAKSSRDDNSSQEIDLKDAYVGYQGIHNTKIIIGQQKTPNTLEQANSSYDQLFTEIPLMVEAFTNRLTAGGDYKIGAQATYEGSNYLVSGGIFGENSAAYGGTSTTSSAAQGVYHDEGWGPAARFVYTPIKEPTKLIHLGLSGYYRNTAGKQFVQFRSGPEVDVDSTRLVDTGALKADDYEFGGVELAGVYGPFFLQSEYGVTKVDRLTGSNVSFGGGYAEVSYTLTGESKPYKSGAFLRTKPKRQFDPGAGNWGAWEVAARYSTLDLNDKDIRGGTENNWSLGLNWYPNDYIRFLVDYVNFDAKRNGVKQEGDVVITRASVAW
ncbi:MAG: porin [Parvibaculaceae bacterium]|nr:porin [Parvibaculaceae bacterium]